MITELKDIRSSVRSKTNVREYFRLNDRIKIAVRTIKMIFEDKITGETKIERTGEIAEHVTLDISAGGLQFFSREHYRDNMHLEITLYFKQTDP
ncbi:MAG: PilZ domain-containing protein, partial [Nitrospirae bacterium]|nr:PilZ domain-containing protein [Nitrospirota bacterium]